MVHQASTTLLELIWNLIFALAGILYLLAAAVSKRRHKPWPLSRCASFLAGAGCAAAALSGSLAHRAHDDFAAHMWGHLLLGMLAPLLLASARPVTLALRSLPVTTARRLSRIFKSRPIRFICDPATATLFNVGGLWVLYASNLYAASQHNPLLHELVHAHVLLAGYLFTASVLSWEPVAHRTSFFYRATVLLAALSAHGMLAKYIYAHPPAGVPAEQAQAGGMLMYYGGDAIDFALIYIFCYLWYTSVRPKPEAAAQANLQ